MKLQLRGGALVGTIAALAALLSGPVAALTLEDAVRAALRNNPDVLIARDDARIAVHERRQAQAGYYPSLDLRGATGIEQSRTATLRNQSGSTTDPTLWRSESGVTLRQNLFDGFATSGDVDRGRAREAAAGERVRVSANSVALATIEAYLEVLRNTELVRIARLNLEHHEDVLTRARARAGVTETETRDSPAPSGIRGDTTELPRAEARLSGARATLEQTRGRLRDAEATFMRVVGQRPRQLAPVAVPRANLPADEEAAIEKAVSLSPAMKAANRDIEAATAEIQQADARFLPRLDLELAGNRNKNIDGIMGMNNDASALLVLRYNLYQGGADAARRRAALERLAKARNTLLQTRRNLEQETEISWNALTTARARLPILSSQQRQSDFAREAYQQQYQIGRTTLIFLLDAESDYFNAASNFVTGELTTRFGEYRLLAAMSALFEVLGIPDPDVMQGATAQPAP